MARKSETFLRRQDKAMAAGDMAAFWGTFADDVVVHIGGRNKMSGDIKGLEELKRNFEGFMRAIGDNPKFETHDVIANDKHGVVLQRFTGERNGQRNTIESLAVFHLSGEKITEAWFIDVDPHTADAWYDAGLN